jgi:hypothetical protein
MTLMIPALFGVSVSQINLLLDTFIASLLVSGSVSWLYFSDRLVELPLGIFGIAIATVVLPSLSRKHADKSLTEFAAMLDWAFRMVLLIAIPASLALILLAQPSQLSYVLQHSDTRIIFTSAEFAERLEVALEGIDHGITIIAIDPDATTLFERAHLPDTPEVRSELALYYDEELNLKEIGQVLGVSESRVSQIHTQAALRLRSRLNGWD